MKKTIIVIWWMIRVIAKFSLIIINIPFEIMINIFEWLLWHMRYGQTCLCDAIYKSFLNGAVWLDEDEKEDILKTASCEFFTPAIVYRSRVYLTRSIDMMKLTVNNEDEAQ